MRLNQKLTPIIAGRGIEAVTQKDELAHLTFTDGSVMSLKLSKPVPENLNLTARIKTVKQSANIFGLEFTDNSMVQIILSEDGSGVLLRDANGQIEYAD